MSFLKEPTKMLLRIYPRERCPKDIKAEFQASPVAPKSFIDWHRKRAEDELTAICSYSGAKVHNQWMQDDGWFDGFQALHAIVETQKEKLIKIKWNDGTQCFMRRGEAGGWFTMSTEILDNQEFCDLMRESAELAKTKNFLTSD
tara:strand:- start:400 stop:831 length:432 start_codon:yes stop_codon:yes gene_type:complete